MGNLSARETAVQEDASVHYTIDFDRKHWFIKREPAVIAGGFATKEDAAEFLQEFLTEKKYAANVRLGNAANEGEKDARRKVALTQIRQFCIKDDAVIARVDAIIKEAQG